jgi:hypothetical protein
VSPALLQLPAAFGLAGASGLNATLPLFLTSLLARLGYVHLSGPFTALQSDLAFYGLLVLAIAELAADKIPVFDSVFHAVMLPLAAASGAILFAIQTGTIQGADPSLVIVLSLVAGAVTAGAVHATRATARPVSNLALLGPVISSVEDVLAALVTFVALLLPVVLPVLLLVVAGAVYLLVSRFRRSRQASAGAR